MKSRSSILLQVIVIGLIAGNCGAAFAGFCSDLQVVLESAGDNFRSIAGRKIRDKRYSSRVFFDGAKDCYIRVYKSGNVFSCSWDYYDGYSAYSEYSPFIDEIKNCFEAPRVIGRVSPARKNQDTSVYITDGSFPWRLNVDVAGGGEVSWINLEVRARDPD